MESYNIKHIYVQMNRKLIFAATTLMIAVGCNKFREEINDYKDPLDDGRPVEIRFSSVVNTKASLSGLNDSHDLYIYGLNRTTPGVQEIINAKAHMAKPVGAGEKWEATDGSLVFFDTTFFYNATRDKYDFYGYHLADAAVVPDKLTNYQIDITIDGTQDILLASADPEKDIQRPGVKPEVTNTDYVYSAWSTRRGVTPRLVFSHALAKFEFEVQNLGTLPVVLQSIEITSKTKGLLTVVNQPPTSADANDGLVQGLVVKDDDVETVMELKSPSFVKGGAILDRGEEGDEDDIKVDGIRLEGNMPEPVALLGEIMTFAEQDNKVIVKLMQKGMKEGQFRKITMPITLDETENFGTRPRQGYTYLVSLVVYSLEEVGVNISLLKWDDGGNVSLDQEDKVNHPESGYEDVIVDADNPSI